MKKISLFLLFAISALTVNAQEQEKLTDAHVSNYRDWSIGLGFGNSFLGGELSSWEINGPNGDAGDFNFGPTGVLTVSKYFNTVWGVRFNGEIGQMKGDRGTNLPRFETFFINTNLQASINLSALALRGKTGPRKGTHLVLLGGGFHHSQPDYFDAAGNLTELRGTQGENWNNLAMLTADYNFKYQLSKALDLDVLVGARYYLGDNVDGVGQNGVTGNGGSSSDVGVYTGVGISYNFGNKSGQKTNKKVAAVYGNPLDEIYGDLEQIKSDYDKLTSDDDGDGVNNLMDKDNSTPENATVDGSGVATDVDGDGIPDHMDQDPFTMKGAKVDADGRAVDSDSDGVPDNVDQEANTPEDALVNHQGITIPTDQGLGAAALPAVYFGFNSATVNDANIYRIANIASVLKAHQDLKVRLTGYTDSRGSEQYNKNLGERRAKEVAEQLTKYFGIDSSRIMTQSGGESNALAKDIYKVNRRVEVQPVK